MTTRNVVPLICIYAVLSLITNFPSGFTNSTVNTATEEVHSFLNTSFVQRGWNLSAGSIALVQSATLNCWFVSQVFGSMFTPYITDNFGRKIGYMIAVAVTIAATLVQYFSILFYLPEGLILGRSLTALCSPLADACLLLYVQETSPVSIRGTASFFCEIGYGMMCILGSILGMRSVLGSTLDRLLLVSIVPEILSLIFLFFIPDTPKYLMIMKGDRRAALKSLNFFHGESKANEEVLDEFEREKMQDTINERSSFKEVFTTWHLRQAVFLSCCVLVLTLSFYPMLQSSTYFFLNSGVNSQLAETSSTLLLTVFTVAGVVGAAFIDRFPRRMLILISGVITNVFLVAFAVLSFTHDLCAWIKYACVGSIFCYCVCFGLVLGPISWFVAPEMVSQRHKATIFSICFAINNIFIALTDFASIPLFRLIGGFSFVALFTIPSIICMVLIYLYLPETLGRETHQIVASMLRKRNKRTVDLEGKEAHPRYQVFTASASCAALQ